MDTNMLIVLGIVTFIVLFSIISFVVVVVFKEEESDIKEASKNNLTSNSLFSFLTSNIFNGGS